MEYNTARPQLSIREYGRHIQKMVDYVVKITDRDKRNKQTKVIIELMGLLNPHLKNVEDFRHILWDHLFFISDFKLDVDSPYPLPTRETYKAKPEPLPYPNVKPKYAHLGRNLETLIGVALKEEDSQKKDACANLIAYYMKLCYTNWHKEVVHDEVIRTELSNITKGELDFSKAPKVKFTPNNDMNKRRANGANNGNKKQGLYKSNNNNNGNKPSNQGQPRNNNAGSSNNNRNNNFKKRY